MVAQTITLPNVRKIFVPDPGYLLVSADLVGADAQVVAWEAEDEDLKSAFRAGLKLHIKNARDLFPDETRNMTDEELKATDRAGGLYHNCKKCVHLTNYIGGVKTMAAATRWPEPKCEEFQERWFFLHPGIKKWHRRLERTLQGRQCWRCWAPHEPPSPPECKNCGARPSSRTIGNKFGYRIIYFDRIDSLLTKAVAWPPQSTVALNCSLGALTIEEKYPFVQILLQVHDELVFQIPVSQEHLLPDIKRDLHISIPYNDPLTISWSIKTSRDSWGM